MPFWPLLMGWAAVMTLYGVVVGGWRVPATALLGYVLMRANMSVLPADVHEVAGNALWVYIGAALCYQRAWVAGFLFVCSGLTYSVFLVFGIRLEYLGISAIVAEIFATLALLSIGGGLRGFSWGDFIAGFHRA